MSQSDIPEFDSFEPVDSDEDDSAGERIDLEPGDHYVGEITDVNFNAGDNGVIQIDGREVWLNATMRRQIQKALVHGVPVAYAKSEDTESFEDEDGEEVEYNPRELRFMGD